MSEWSRRVTEEGRDRALDGLVCDHGRPIRVTEEDWLEAEAADLEPEEAVTAPRHVMTWRGLSTGGFERWMDDLYWTVAKLCRRYHLPVRSGWWADERQLEALAALVIWVDRYDWGEWDDPPGKLSLLFDLERVGTMLRDGSTPFDPHRDHAAFCRELVALRCRDGDALEREHDLSIDSRHDWADAWRGADESEHR